jgi:uncharacterized protein YjbI with pentapeptide repeats
MGRLLLIVTLAAAAVAYAVALWKAPGWMRARSGVDRYDARVLVISVGGAVVVSVGLLYTARNYRLSRRGQVTDRFTKALERLGSGELYVRIGGVRALEHVMRDSADHHDDVIEVMTAFVRRRAPRHVLLDGRMFPEDTASVQEPSEEPEADVQDALAALGRRPYRPERRTVDLSALHLAGARLDTANLARANLDNTTLNGAELSHAELTGVSINFADLTGAALNYADLSGASAHNAKLAHSYLRGTDLSGAQLPQAELIGAMLVSANLAGASLRDADLTGADLRNANLSGAVLNSANLRRASLIGANLSRAFLDRAELTGAVLIGADLTGAFFGDADLAGAVVGENPPVVPTGWVVTKAGVLSARK